MDNKKDINAVIHHTTKDGWNGDILINSTFSGSIMCPVGWIKNDTVEILCKGT